MGWQLLLTLRSLIGEPRPPKHLLLMNLTRSVNGNFPTYALDRLDSWTRTSDE